MFSYRLIGILLFFTTLVFSRNIETVWQSHNLALTTMQKSDKPLEEIQTEIARGLNDYLLPRQRIDISAMIPAEVQNPVEPERIAKPKVIQHIKLTQGKYERKEDFNQRVAKEKDRYTILNDKQSKQYISAVKQRNQDILVLENIFKKQVQERNQKLLYIQSILDKDILKIKKEQEEKEKNLERYLPIFFKNAFKKYLGSPYLCNTEYFVNSEVMVAELCSSRNGLKQKIEFEIDPDEAKAFDNNLLKVKPKIFYQMQRNLKENELTLRRDRIELSFNNRHYVVRENLQSYTNNFSTVSLQIDDPTNVSIESEKLSLQAESLQLAFQEAKFKTFNYRVSNSSNNDILQRLKALRPVKKDSKKWLFVIGIERYKNGVDPIAYSKQSARSFAAVAQKMLGISHKNSFVLLDNDTTSGQIKSDFKRMLSFVNKGDSIYFYYSGHGIPVPQDDNEPYLLPKDIDPSFIDDETFFKLKNIYKRLSDSKASQVFAIIDSCFSGATDGVSVMKGVAAARLVPKKVRGFNKDKMVIITAGRKKQYSNMYIEKEQRLFSYFIMNALLENKKRAGTLYDDVHRRVLQESRKMGNLKLQEPVLDGNKYLIF